MKMEDLEKALTEQIMDLKINDEAPCEDNMLPTYFEGTEDDYLQWLEMLKTALASARNFEIHCWNGEDEWINLALKYGTLKEDEWKYGKIITGEVTSEFKKMLLEMPKPQNVDIFKRITPFLNVFLDNGFQSSHYGLELYIRKA